MSNTHGIADFGYELQATCEDLLPACVVSTTWPTVPVPPSLTLAAFATLGYVRDGQALPYVEQSALPLTLSGSDGTYWLGLTRDVSTAYASWTRRAGSHYVWRLSGTRPPDIDGLLVFASCAVAGGAITVVTPAPGVTRAEAWRTLGGLGTMAPQNANAVAITGGSISLGGHAPTGVLDVQGSVVASDAAQNYHTVRAWPIAPSGATEVNGLRVEGVTGAASATATQKGLVVRDMPVTSGQVMGVDSRISAGTNRYNIYAVGTAANYFAGIVGLGTPPVAPYVTTFATGKHIMQTGAQLGINVDPSYPLDVGTYARIQGSIGLGTVPATTNRLALLFDKNTMSGMVLQAVPGTDGGGQFTQAFLNGAGTVVGSITQSGSATGFNTSSDARLKHSIAPLTDALATLLALRPVAFRWNSTDEPDEGFLAHEAQQVVPHAVQGQPDEVNPDGSIKPQQIDHSKLVVWLTAALQEAVAQVQTLTARVDALEAALGL